MTDTPKASGRITPAGLMFLAVTSLGWGFNWPVTKHLVGVLPPLTLRGSTGVVGAALLALLAILRSQSLAVPREVWPRLIIAGLLNVTVWMVLMGLALLWLPAGEAALIAYTMPVWASILAWPILGERPTWLRVLALLLAFAGLAGRQPQQRQPHQHHPHRDIEQPGDDQPRPDLARHGQALAPE
ncbi:DMT family transporter, partial [Bradyrhizobium sp.]|uniref:DMT family transporter n=1 Tax=Bradyrhizobium sp. TaxID=376 RepID=UPI00391959E8